MTPGSRYVQLLQAQPSANNGTVTGGLAHVLQQWMMGSQMKKDERDEEAVSGRLAQALQAYNGTPENTITWNQPTRFDGTGGPTTTIPAKPGNPALAMQILSGSEETLPFAWELATRQETQPDLVEVVDPNDPTRMILVPETQAAGMQSSLPEAASAPDVRDFYEGDQRITKQWNPATQTWDPLATAPRWDPQRNAGDGGTGGPFEGTNLDAQAMNLLLRGDPSSPEYLAAWNYLSAPKSSIDPKSGMMVSITPDMSAFRLPTSLAGPVGGSAPPPAGAPGATPPPAMTPPPTDAMGPGRTVTEEQVTSGSMTEGQALSAGYADRMLQAVPILAKFETAGTDFGDALASQVPLVGNYAVSEEFQQLDQARRNFLAAILRKESGAAIADHEMANGLAMYFPVPGDSPAVIKQKRANREAALNAMIRNAGPTYKRPGDTTGTDTFNDYLDNLHGGGNTDGWSIQQVQ